MKRRSQADDEAAYQRAFYAATIQRNAAWMPRHNLPGAPTADHAREMARYPASRSNRKRHPYRQRSDP